jgi:hypothetical protein
MPFNLSLFSFLASLIWLVYGVLGRDPYIMVILQKKKLYYHVVHMLSYETTILLY